MQYYFSIPQSSLKCAVCLDVMRRPVVQTKNGHSFCSRCVKSKICPICKARTQFVRNYALEKLLEDIHTECREEGCFWSGSLSDLNKHSETCDIKLKKEEHAFMQTCSLIKSLLDKTVTQHIRQEHPTIFRVHVQGWNWITTEPNSLLELFSCKGEEWQSIQCEFCSELLRRERSLLRLEQSRLSYLRKRKRGRNNQILIE